jgi:hypothetical protein
MSGLYLILSGLHDLTLALLLRSLALLEQQ